MFSRRNRRDSSADSATQPPARPDFSTPEVAEAWAKLDAGDVPGALRGLRACAQSAPLGEIAVVTGRAAATTGFDDLRDAAAKVVAEPEDGSALYDFGYACIERGIGYLAIPALRAVVRTHPQALGPRRELVAAYEDQDRHGEAVDLLLAHEADLDDWPDRYLLVFNAVTSGRLDLAEEQFAKLGAPDEEMWEPVHARLGRVMARAAAVRGTGASPLDPDDLRGWQYVLRGSLLGHLSPFGFDAGMRGRYAYVQDSYDTCRAGIERLSLALEATGQRPTTVSLLPDRASRILGLAAAELLGLPAVPFEPAREQTVVVAYDLSELLAPEAPDACLEALRALVSRTPGQVLHEHASCWTDTPPVTADSVGLLAQTVVAPWGERLQGRADHSGVDRLPADARPEAELAAEIVSASAEPDQGDGATPPDPDTAFASFAAALAPTWLQGRRDRVRAMGPVPSSRFA
ncbi:hypothetical protein [Streptacidiphilus jiangxiensis]|uniref:Tetratricopeptide repeat-containing protein n=1 Tax=Streptacidiphilus jiangxiensis TaxID=235985 RepID=A0A1H7N364_STRJI|nr:hypothetical protein [Streptacidiphilus jiangxiensis]SEL17759.1 hypothetical protein SAMN05414137_106184 [Streptacidiphilus jiangxiensis]